MEIDLSEKWGEAADSEYQSLMQNETWECVVLPKERKLLDADGDSSRQNEEVRQSLAIYNSACSKRIHSKAWNRL